MLWILDGLDEVIDATARQTVSHWIQQAIGDRTDDYFLVTCRFAGYYRKGVPLGAPFAEFHVRPLDDTQIARFVHDWYTAAYDKLLLSAQAESRVNSLLEILAKPAWQSGRIRELCTNPMLLTILCIVFHDDQKLPNKRSELYGHCVRVLLEHWRQGVYEAFDGKAAELVLSRIAWWMHSQQERTSAPLQELAEQARVGLMRMKKEDGLGKDGLKFLERMKEETGIIASDNDGRSGFLHLSFQEFLAAEFAANHAKASELAPKIADSWWQEVALLSLRHSEPYCEAFFREMLAAGIAENHPDLADRCLTEALSFAPEPFIEVLRNKEPFTRVAAVLRLLQGRTDEVPGLETLVTPLAKSRNASIRSAVQEILVRMGLEQPVTSESQQVIIAGPTDIAFVRIPAGKFKMGSPKSAWDQERPVHPVHISKDFLLAKYPVTNAQYAEFMRAAGTKSRKPDYWDERRFNQPEQPVVGVSWHNVQAFCKWAGCRLPTEAEWEYACRAGTTSEYSFGDDAKELEQYAWYDKNSSNQSQPVGTKQPNPWGLHDMHGNVWEWCQDWFSDKYYGKSPEVDPTGPKSGDGRVLRGGSWYDPADNCRSSVRHFTYHPENRYGCIGFRVARTL